MQQVCIFNMHATKEAAPPEGVDDTLRLRKPLRSFHAYTCFDKQEKQTSKAHGKKPEICKLNIGKSKAQCNQGVM
jgi:hypothetical protein